MDDLIAQLRYMLRHPVRSSAATLRAAANTELGAELKRLVRNPVRTLRETFGPVLDDIARGLGR